ncbi:H-NS family nucleoid-associated regulatory protein [Alcaligenes nematophilus]|uniref:H-NS histone family protein n=1 Tax=Alcaligenes nematophilus TaxID=2994643 RepID=UPI0034E06841
MPKKTYAQIQKEIDRLQREAQQLRDKEAAEVAARIREAIDAYGFTVEDLFGKQALKRRKPSNARRTKAAPTVKYADGAGNTWGGRGPRPHWFRAALEAGKKAEDLLA